GVFARNKLFAFLALQVRVRAKTPRTAKTQRELFSCPLSQLSLDQLRKLVRSVHCVCCVQTKLPLYIFRAHLRISYRPRNDIDLYAVALQQLFSTPRPNKVSRAKDKRRGRVHQLLVVEDRLDAVASQNPVPKLDHNAVGSVLGKLR